MHAVSVRRNLLLGSAGPASSWRRRFHSANRSRGNLVSPLSVHFYQDAGHGFHVETLAPALCLVLFYFLLQQRLIPSIVAGLAVISAKEEAPIAAAIVAIIAGVETWTSSAGKPIALPL